MPEHDPLVRLLHMRDYAEAALRLSERGNRRLLDEDEMYSFSMIHAVAMIGQTAAQVSREVQQAAPEIPWTDIIGMRHRLIHGYEFVRHDIVWDTVTVDVPDLLPKLFRLIDQMQAAADVTPHAPAAEDETHPAAENSPEDLSTS
ncbi:MAG TPA: hypothetical protein DEP45_01810 [Armatimonadetes bacterium]|nr:hypothetical protein [Armatimonadota bacterium]